VLENILSNSHFISRSLYLVVNRHTETRLIVSVLYGPQKHIIISKIQTWYLAISLDAISHALHPYNNPEFSIWSKVVLSSLYSLFSMMRWLSLDESLAREISMSAYPKKLVWNFLVVSKKYVLKNFAPHSNSHISESLKKAMITKTRITNKEAMIPPSLLPEPVLVIPLKTAKDTAAPNAKINIWTMVMVTGPTVRCILNIPLGMSLGNNTFISAISD